ncbi:hypothetical protein PV04_07746 [Phialophora macrospora]|uniref:Lysine-specific metallo-endopeptidase domain-containing protein n=1 Tax=Phialophora macrospora TaxID=1851006 RepID=A0A0D2G071_9EURO|nr:hypothetical protein PV04_07746 [Phialophora macrospora]
MSNNDNSIDALCLSNHDCPQSSCLLPASLRTEIRNPLVPLTAPDLLTAMMRLQSLTPLLLALTFLFFSTPLLAAVPTVWIDPTFPPDLRARLSDVWSECIQLARLAAITFEADCKLDPTFARYFEEDGAVFVKHIFYTLANIPLDTVMTEANAGQILLSSSFVGLSPKFSMLTIAFGEPPWLPKSGICSGDDGFGAYSLFNDATGYATTVICVGSLYYPTLDEILRPRAWAYDEQGRLREGYTCDGLLDRDSEYMLSPGGWLLHELIHWEVLFEDDVPEWDQFLALGGRNFRIRDFGFPGSNPATGYGAYHARILKERAISDPTEVGVYPTFNNADSYMWYAISKYWSWRCGRPFRGAQSTDDEFHRTWQGVGYNGADISPGAQHGGDHPSPGTTDYYGDDDEASPDTNPHPALAGGVRRHHKRKLKE